MKEASASGGSLEIHQEGNNPAGKIESRMSENVAGLLCYLLGWLSGLILFLTDKRPFVRFHAAQSIVIFGGLNILIYIASIVFGFGFMVATPSGFSRAYEIYRLVDLGIIALWIVLMLKAYQRERFRLPIAADLVDKLFGKQ